MLKNAMVMKEQYEAMVEDIAQSIISAILDLEQGDLWNAELRDDHTIDLLYLVSGEDEHEDWLEGVNCDDVYELLDGTIYDEIDEEKTVIDVLNEVFDIHTDKSKFVLTLRAF